jgi:hypothetical protein
VIRSALLLIAAVGALPVGAQRPGSAAPSERGAGGRSARNPAVLHATQLLEPRVPGAPPRVRFEWAPVPGSPAYLLSGSWLDPQSWALRSLEYRVTPRTATQWGDARVTFDLSLPEGTHSWKLVALFGRRDDGDYASPTHVSFDLR